MIIVGRLPQKWLRKIGIALFNRILIGGWRINNAIIHQKKSRNKSTLNKDSVIFLATKQNPRVLEFLFEELPSKGDDATVSQGCLCILDPKVYFFIWWYLLRPLHWYLWQLWWLLFYHLPIQLQHKLEHLKKFSVKNHYYNFDLPLGLFHCATFFKEVSEQIRSFEDLSYLGLK